MTPIEEKELIRKFQEGEYLTTISVYSDMPNKAKDILQIPDLKRVGTILESFVLDDMEFSDFEVSGESSDDEVG